MIFSLSIDCWQVRTLSLPTSRKAYLVRKAMIFSRTDEEEKLAELKRKFELQR